MGAVSAGVSCWAMTETLVRAGCVGTGNELEEVSLAAALGSSTEALLRVGCAGPGVGLGEISLAAELGGGALAAELGGGKASSGIRVPTEGKLIIGGTATLFPF